MISRELLFVRKTLAIVAYGLLPHLLTLRIYFQHFLAALQREVERIGLEALNRLTLAVRTQEGVERIHRGAGVGPELGTLRLEQPKPHSLQRVARCGAGHIQRLDSCRLCRYLIHKPTITRAICIEIAPQ